MTDNFSFTVNNNRCEVISRYNCDTRTRTCKDLAGGPSLSLSRINSDLTSYHNVSGRFDATFPINTTGPVHMMQWKPNEKELFHVGPACDFNADEIKLIPHLMNLSYFYSYTLKNMLTNIKQMAGSNDIVRLKETAIFLIAVQWYRALKDMGNAPQGVRGKLPDGGVDQKVFVESFVAGLNNEAKRLNITFRANATDPTSIKNVGLALLNPPTTAGERPSSTTEHLISEAENELFNKYVEVLLNFYSFPESSESMEAQKERARDQIRNQMISEAAKKGVIPVDVARHYLAGSLLRVIRKRGISLAGLKSGGDYVGYLYKLFGRLKKEFSIEGYNEVSGPEIMFDLTGKIIPKTVAKIERALGSLGGLQMVASSSVEGLGRGMFKVNLKLNKTPKHQNDADYIKWEIKKHIRKSLGNYFDLDVILRNVSLVIDVPGGDGRVANCLRMAFKDEVGKLTVTGLSSKSPGGLRAFKDAGAVNVLDLLTKAGIKAGSHGIIYGPTAENISEHTITYMIVGEFNKLRQLVYKLHSVNGLDPAMYSLFIRPNAVGMKGAKECSRIDEKGLIHPAGSSTFNTYETGFMSTANYQELDDPKPLFSRSALEESYIVLIIPDGAESAFRERQGLIHGNILIKLGYALVGETDPY